MTDILPVTQVDREAAAKHLRGVYSSSAVRSGRYDHSATVQAFARHRHQSTTSLEEERDALARRVGVLEGALRPFANAADIHFDHAEGDTMMVLRYRSGEPTGACLASLDRARAALNTEALKGVRASQKSRPNGNSTRTPAMHEPQYHDGGSAGKTMMDPSHAE